MKVKFTKDIVVDNSQPEKVKKRRWDRWLYLGILFILFASFIRWLTTPWFFDLAHGILLQEQYDVKFTDDIRILEYKVHEDEYVLKGDTLFSYQIYDENTNINRSNQDSLQVIRNHADRKKSLIDIEAQIEKRRLFLIALKKRLNFWQSERVKKEKLVYLNVITQNELANVDRSVDDTKYEIATIQAEYQTLIDERLKLLQGVSNANRLDRVGFHLNNRKTYFTSPVDGSIDRIAIQESQVCYKPEKVFSIIKPIYFVRAYIEMSDLDEFEVGDDVVVVLPYGHKNLAGKVNKMYAVSETKDEVIIDNSVLDYKHGVVIEILPANCEGWDKLKVSNIPVRVRKGIINL